MDIFFHIFIVFIIFALSIGFIIFASKKIKETAKELSFFIKENFLVQPCSKCHEFSMRLLDISPNARSVHYQCMHCGKKCVLLREHPMPPR